MPWPLVPAFGPGFPVTWLSPVQQGPLVLITLTFEYGMHFGQCVPQGRREPRLMAIMARAAGVCDKANHGVMIENHVPGEAGLARTPASRRGVRSTRRPGTPECETHVLIHKPAVEVADKQAQKNEQRDTAERTYLIAEIQGHKQHLALIKFIVGLLDSLDEDLCVLQCRRKSRGGGLGKTASSAASSRLY